MARATFYLAVFLLVSPLVWADEKTRDHSPNTASQEIHITADKLVSNINGKYAEFSGNVRAIQETTVITADRLRIYYKGKSSRKEKLTASNESLEKIVATGNVRINFDDKVATTDQAVYTAASQVLVLTGENSTVISGNNSIIGSRITLDRVDGRITVERGSGSRVEAVIFAGDEGLK